MSEEVEENVPIFLSFSDIGVKIRDRLILQNVSGKVHPGEMLAVMGPSGSGKTTLLNVLAGRLCAGTGDILLNGKSLSSNKKLRKKICYVLQEDIFFANLTLLETLTFSAMLRLPDTLSKAEKLKKVQETVDNLDIRKCLHTKIGSPFERGLSGGEKKRANIGCELITNPSLIFLDEPTSGLDSSNALNLVKTLKNFAAREKKTIVTTIHQPSSQIFYMFDKVLLLCGGQVAYYGKASRVLDFFESIGLVCDAHFNPADFILEKVTEGESVQEKIVSGWKERRQRYQKLSPVSYRDSKQRTGRDKIKEEDMEGGEDAVDKTKSAKTLSSESVKQSSRDSLKERSEPLEADDGTPKQVSDGGLSVDAGKGNSERLQENAAGSLEQDLSSSSSSSDVSEEHSLLFNVGSPTLLSREVQEAVQIPNGKAPYATEETESVSQGDADEGCVPLICKPSHLRRTGSASRSAEVPTPVHTEVQLSSVDFSVAVKTFKRSTSQDYTKIDMHEHEDEEDHSKHYIDISTSWSTSFWTQLTVLLQRTFKQSKPEILSKLNFIQNVLLAMIAGLIWFQVPYKEESIVDRYSLLFFMIVYWNFAPLFQSLVSFPNERTVVNKERAAGYYRLSAYYLAKLFSELPLVITQPALFLTIVYWMSGLNRSEAFLGMLAVLLLTAIAGQSVGLCIGAAVMDFKKSIVVASVYGLSCMLLGGFYQKNIPPWLSWIQYLGYITYSYDASLSVEFYNSPPFSCREKDSSYPLCNNNGTVIRGRDILEELNVSRTVAQNVAALLMFIIIFRVLAYFSLRYIHKPRQ